MLELASPPAALSPRGLQLTKSTPEKAAPFPACSGVCQLCQLGVIGGNSPVIARDGFPVPMRVFLSAVIPDDGGNP